MNITINAEPKEVADAITLEKLLDDLDIKDKVMAAAINTQIVKQDQWSSRRLADGDKLELLDFVGGG